MSEFDFGLPFLSEEKGAPPCSETDPEAFFPQDIEGKITAIYYNEHGAKQVCSTCVYKIDCMIFAIKNGEVGIWGGTTDGQRRNIKRMAKYNKKSIEEIALEQK